MTEGATERLSRLLTMVPWLLTHQGVELADVLEQSDPVTVVKRAGDGHTPGDVRRSVGIGDGRCEAVEKFVRCCVGVERAPSHTAGHQLTSAQVDQGRGHVGATYLQCPDELRRPRRIALGHGTNAFTTRTVSDSQAFTV